MCACLYVCFFAVYVEAAKARKARMQERGAEVERLMALKGTPLLVDTDTPTSVEPRRRCCTASGPRSNSKVSDKNLLVNDGDIARDEDEKLASRSERRAPDAAEGAAGGGVDVLARHDVGVSSLIEKKAGKLTSGRGAELIGTAITRGTDEEAWGQDSVVGCSMSIKAAPRLLKTSTAPTTLGEIEIETRRALCPTPLIGGETLDIERVAATASVPLLPCFSQLGSPLILMGGRHPALAAKIEGVDGARGRWDVAMSETRRNVGLVASAPAVAKVRTSTLAANIGGTSVQIGDGEGEVAPVVKAFTAQTARWSRVGGIGGVSAADQTLPPTAAAVRTAIMSAAREHAQMLLASHLTPFPTITKNRSLHAVPQPIVTHSEGFADACTGETSQLGYAAWRLTASARHDGLVAPAERQSIVRQIEAGFDALQGRRVSALA